MKLAPLCINLALPMKTNTKTKIFTLFFLSMFTSLSCREALIRISEPVPGGYLIENTSIFSAVKGQKTVKNQNVLLRGNRIARISSEKIIAPGAKIIDGRGKTLLPGLIDFHTHITLSMAIPWKLLMPPTDKHNLEALLFTGVTTIVDMSGHRPARMHKIAEKIRKGRLKGPRLYNVGLGLSVKNGHPSHSINNIKKRLPPGMGFLMPEMRIEVGDDYSVVAKHLDEKPHFTKIYLERLPDTAAIMSAAKVKKIVEMSHKRGIRTVFHIGKNQNLRTLIDAGGDGAVHMVYRDKMTPALAKELAARKIFVAPTLVVFENLNLVGNYNSVNHYIPLQRAAMDKGRLNQLKHYRKVKAPADVRAFIASLKENQKHWLYNIRLMHEAGVTLIAGSDAPNMMNPVGGALHRELELMVQAGLSPADAIRTATIYPARILDKSGSFGTVEEGKIADLLLVNGDPLKNIKATRDIAEVFSRGRRIIRNLK